MSTSKTIQANSSKILLKESKVRILYPKMQRERNLSLQHSRSILSYNQYSKLQNYYCKKSKTSSMNKENGLRGHRRKWPPKFLSINIFNEKICS